MSVRAKRNMRSQINAQIRLLGGIVRDKWREYGRIKRYRKYRLPGQARMERASYSGFKKASNDLKIILRRKQKLTKLGRI